MTTEDDSPIYEFREAYRFLSNFYIEPDGSHVEREYQAQKCADPKVAVFIMTLSPSDAKKYVRTVQIRVDWEQVKVETMRLLVWQKFVDHPNLEKLLLETGDRELIEGNYWRDSFWGKVNGGRGIGENQLGKILMETRERMRTLNALR